MAWDGFPGGLNCNPSRTGYPISPFYVKIDGQPTGTRFDAPARPEFGYIASLFAQNFKKSGYKMSFAKPGDKWTVADISGSGGIFNSVNLGILITHGSYGETVDSQNVLNTYLWHNDGTYARLRDLQLGSTGENGLRWMSLFTCSSLRPANVTSMINRGFMTTIITENLHLLLGTETVILETPRSGWMYATNLVAEQTIPDAWYNALRNSLIIANNAHPGSVTGTVTSRVLGWNPCFNDTIHYFNDPDTSEGLRSLSRQVWP